MATQMRVGNIIQNEKASWINMHKYIIFFFTVQFFGGFAAAGFAWAGSSRSRS